MTIVGCFGVFFNLASFIFFARQKCHRTFHRFVFATSFNVIEQILQVVNSHLNLNNGKQQPFFFGYYLNILMLIKALGRVK